MRTLLTSLAVLLVTLATVSAQSPRLELRRVGNQWMLDYQPSPQQGASILHFSPDLPGLPSSNASILDVPAASALMPLDVTSLITGERGFFAITELPGLSIADFAVNDDAPVIVEEPPTYTAETLTDMAFPLTTATPLRVHFRLLNGTTGDPVGLSGSVRLELRTASGGPVGFAYTLTPNTLPLSAGIVDDSVTITTAGDLTDVYIAVAEITLPAPPPGAKSAAAASAAATIGNSNLGNKPKILSAYLNTAPGWHYPLPALKTLAGCFGEWRSGGTAGSGIPHFGMDLAVAAGTDVRPVKRGVVSWIGSLGADGKYLAVVHGDGTASRYLHVVPVAQVHQIVETNTVIARTADIAADHLHLELRSGANTAPTAGAYTAFGAFPGAAFDPGVVNESFDSALIQAGANDVNAPQIKALYVWGKNPKTTPFAAAPPSSAPNQTSPGEPGSYLIAQIVDKEGSSPTSGYLVPAHFDFAVEDPATRALVVRDSFDYHTDTEMKKLFQDSVSSFGNFGYVRRAGNVLPLPAAYQYWFKWDTSIYSSQKLGPRQVRLSVSDRAGHATSQTYSFGPELINPGNQTVDPAAPNGSSFTLTVKSFMGPFPAAQMAQAAAPRDEITFSFEGNTASWDAYFLDPTVGNAEFPTLKKTFIGDSSGIKQDTVQFRVKKKAAAVTPTLPETLTIKGASGTFPSIAHTINVEISPVPAAPEGFALIPAGSFTMGDAFSEGYSDELPVHTVFVSAFYIAQYEANKALWDEVRNWGTANGYTDLPAGGGKGATHPVHSISWYAVAKWCNARSQKEGLTPCYTVSGAIYKTGDSSPDCDWSASGYRLPTEAEWEKAARGGLEGRRFPWGDTISHSQANYFSSTTYSYDISTTRDYHPSYNDGVKPYTSPGVSFAPNGHGLHDMAGNIMEWCWDRESGINSRYTSAPASDPRGAATGLHRMSRSGAWDMPGFYCRTAKRSFNFPFHYSYRSGFRLARSSVP